MSRMIRSNNSITSLQMKCFFISSEYITPENIHTTNYIKDIFED